MPRPRRIETECTRRFMSAKLSDHHYVLLAAPQFTQFLDQKYLALALLQQLQKLTKLRPVEPIIILRDTAYSKLHINVVLRRRYDRTITIAGISIF